MPTPQRPPLTVAQALRHIAAEELERRRNAGEMELEATAAQPRPLESPLGRGQTRSELRQLRMAPPRPPVLATAGGPG